MKNFVQPPELLAASRPRSPMPHPTTTGARRSRAGARPARRGMPVSIRRPEELISRPAGCAGVGIQCRRTVGLVAGLVSAGARFSAVSANSVTNISTEHRSHTPAKVRKRLAAGG